MNERIRELAEQARQYAWLNETHWSAGPERERLFEQKFAELIVRECAEWLKQPVNQTPLSGAVMNIAADRLKEHFRVEE